MPIGVPRIIYCWGEELPAQWTDIYNFIFRRRMVFLMQYLDDELCNQICGLLINIHMEDRSKELEKKETDKSVFKSSSSTKQRTTQKKVASEPGSTAARLDPSTGKPEAYSTSFYNKKSRSVEDLLNADEDLGIEEIDTLEQYTLQKITTEWLNWNAQFFDYSDEPYLFYLAELLSKDFNNSEARMGQRIQNENKEISQLLQMLKTYYLQVNQNVKDNHFDVYSPFRKHAKFQSNDYSLKELNPLSGKEKLLNMFQDYQSKTSAATNPDAVSGEQSSMQVSKQTLPSARLHRRNVVQRFFGVTNKGLAFAGASSACNTLFDSAPSIMDGAQKKEHGNGERSSTAKDKTIYKLLSDLAQKDFVQAAVGRTSHTEPLKKGEGSKKIKQNTFGSSANKNLETQLLSLHVPVGVRSLRHEYNLEKNVSLHKPQLNLGVTQASHTSIPPLSINSRTKLDTRGESYLDLNALSAPRTKRASSGARLAQALLVPPKASPLLLRAVNEGSATLRGEQNATTSEFRDYYRKQTERTLIEEESKKVFVIINSFGGSVGNGITVHDALQFIKAGSLTLALGVAASAASLVLAGGTIGERYVTEGCHTMLHQPESSLSGQASDIWIDSQEIMKIRLDVAEIYSLSTFRPRHKILRDLDRDFYLTAMETIHYGLADEIASNEVMHSIIEMTGKCWDIHDSKQQRLLESRESASAGSDTQTQN